MGFTRIELAVVIGISLLLSVFVIIAIQTSRAETRDIQRLSDVRQIASSIDHQYIETPSKPLEGCNGAYSPLNLCTGPGDIASIAKMADPFAGVSSPCRGKASQSESQSACAYSISSSSGGPEAATDDYEICFFIERGGKVEGFEPGLYRIETGNMLKRGCN